jgi:hypothetical protein
MNSFSIRRAPGYEHVNINISRRLRPRNAVVVRFFCNAARNGCLVFLGHKAFQESQCLARYPRQRSLLLAIKNIITVHLISLKKIKRQIAIYDSYLYSSRYSRIGTNKYLNSVERISIEGALTIGVIE